MSSTREGGSGSKLPSIGAFQSSKGKNVLSPGNRYTRQAGSQNFNEKVGNFRTGTKGPSHASAAPTGGNRMHVVRSNDRNQSSYRGCENNYGQPTVTPYRSYKSVAAKEDNDDAISYKGEEKDDDDNDSEDNANDSYDDSDESDTGEYDTDESQKSHETRKKKKLFKVFFENLDKMNLDEIKKLHCPACKNGPGAECWYKGLQPLMDHAKTIRKGKVKVHREFAELLEEELRIRGTSVIPAGVAFGKWRGLKENVERDKEIIWPPMVIIQNTLLEQDDNEKWLGMGNAELLEYFSAFEAVNSKHSYGPQGHRGTSLLIFEPSAIGFIEAEQLSKHLEGEGLGREAWECCPVRFIPGGQRQLYGYMAEKRDLDSFNKHAHGKSLQKFEMRSYQEVVIKRLKQMSVDNQLLLWFKNRVEKLKKELEVLKGSLVTVTKTIRKVSEENCIVRQRTLLHHKQNKEEMDEHEDFYKNKIKLLDDVLKETEESLKKIQHEREETKSSRIESGNTSILSQLKDMDIYAEERSKLLKDQEERKAELKRQHHEEKAKLEEKLNSELAQLMEKHNPR